MFFFHCFISCCLSAIFYVSYDRIPGKQREFATLKDAGAGAGDPLLSIAMIAHITGTMHEQLTLKCKVPMIAMN